MYFRRGQPGFCAVRPITSNKVLVIGLLLLSASRLINGQMDAKVGVPFPRRYQTQLNLNVPQCSLILAV